ncbi:DUF317 domain-containing protein [Streptomyces sp. B1866]|uniref:DUF317 domain-containing protein n=1 Tax=Streptomyces sp. B1866 TaxID=3075431 RepID=UPI002890E53C|nr:DUF317 domain-containing protein [Streptomyces sp. B1866]MDT3395316.1 DUF317 domain-containing protein [Streptomyces sp. B1866]
MNTPDDEAYWREYHVTPRYLAGSGGTGDPALRPLLALDWHRQDNDDWGSIVLTSPDHRLKVGWFGDDHLLWRIAAYDDPFSAPRWRATFNHTMPTEIVAGLTTALAHDYQDGNDRFLARTSRSWADRVRPLFDAGWKRYGGAEFGTVELLSPDREAGLFIDNRIKDTSEESWELWAGPPGWATRAEGRFTRATPDHLIAATAVAMADPAPVIRCRHHIARELLGLVHLTPLPEQPAPTPARPVPTPLDVRRTAVTQALHRATPTPPHSDRTLAARARTTTLHTSPARADATPPSGVAASPLPSPTRPGIRR